METLARVEPSKQVGILAKLETLAPAEILTDVCTLAGVETLAETTRMLNNIVFGLTNKQDGQRQKLPNANPF